MSGTSSTALGGGGQLLHKAHQVVAKVATDTAGKAGQAGKCDGVRAAIISWTTARGSPVGLAQHRAAGAADGDLVAIGGYRHGRVDANEAVAAQLLTFLHRFEQEAWALAVLCAA